MSAASHNGVPHPAPPLVGTFTILYFSGFTLNTFILLALAIGVVPCAYVVLARLERHKTAAETQSDESWRWLVSLGTDKKSLFGWYRPAQAGSMPEPVWMSDVTGMNLAEAGKNVKSKTEQHNPAALGRTGYSPAGQSRWYEYPV